MLRLIGLQVLTTAVVALLAWPLAGSAAATSALLGGGACVLPNALFALRLTLAARRAGGASASTFFVGELFKVGSTIALLALIVWAYEDLVWLALIIAIIAVLKSYLVAIIWR